MPTPYVEFHGCSAFSFLDGAALPEEMVDTCANYDQPGLALLDRDNVSGVVRFFKQAKKRGIQAHIGALITGADGASYPLLAESKIGYGNLCRLITAMKMRDGKGKAAATDADLEAHAEGLICLSGDAQGPLARALEQDGDGRQCLDRLTHIFGVGNVYLEIQRHYHRDQEARSQRIIELAASTGLPLLATNGACYARPEQRPLQDVLTCVRHKTTIAKAGRILSRNAERHLKSSAAMQALFAHLPEALDNTRQLHQRIQFQLADFGYEFPQYPLPPGETNTSFLRRIVEAAAPHRFEPYTDRVKTQVERELKLIEKLKLEGYFLIVWEIAEFCRNNKILAQGRGSAANSAVCFALGITAVDAVKMELLFERFLSEERGEWPDIDIDLPSGDQRERVIQHVYERYGPRGAAMTANVITYRGRSAVRDIGKVLGFDADLLAPLSKLIPHWGFQDDTDTADKQFRNAGLDPHNPAVRRFLELYHGIQDLPRHLGQHSGGMVVCQGRLDAIVPLEPATMPGRVVIQWDKDDCADMGLIKVDLLGLGMMAVLEDTQALIRAHFQEEVDLARIPADDPRVYDALQRADTIGLFQVESRAQMSCLPRMRPTTFYDIAVQVAIIRPGPIVGKMLNPYLRRRQGKEPPVSLHPSLDECLGRTLGVPLFQEQLLRIAMIAARFTGGQAEELRRAFGFKRSEKRMKEVEVQLREGMAANGIHGETQDTIIQCITSFATYGFPESHAISFALIAYASAYLKCHYLAAFTAAILNNQPMGFYSPSTLVKDAQRHGLRVKPVHVNDSEYPCSVLDRGTIRLGLNYVRGLNEANARAIFEERLRNGPYRSVEDLRRRLPKLHRDQIRMLATIGALNFSDHRRSALWQATRLPRPEGDLLAGLEPNTISCPLPPMTPVERLNADVHGVGLSVGRHPMAFARERLDRLGILPAAALVRKRNGAGVKVAGCVICRQRPGTAHGFTFLSLEDETGISNIILRPDLFDRFKTEIVGSPFLLIAGTLQNLEGVVSVRAQAVEVLPLQVAGPPSHDFH